MQRRGCSSCSHGGAQTHVNVHVPNSSSENRPEPLRLERPELGPDPPRPDPRAKLDRRDVGWLPSLLSGAVVETGA